MKVWFNGELHDSDVTCISPMDRGFLLGDGLFETMAVRAGRVRRLDAHMARLAHGAEVIGLDLPALDLPAVFAETLQANGLEEAVLRLTVTRGAGPRGILPPAETRPSVLVSAAPLPPPTAPARCIVASVTRRNEHSPLARVKSLAYLDNILARREAAARGADEAILLNTAGRVAEASIANLFVVQGGRLATPPLEEGVLAGTMRAAVLALGGEERALEISDLIAAEEVFLTSSLGIRPVAAIGERLFGAGPVTKRIAALTAEEG